MYVCMYVSMYVCMYACIYVCMYLCMYVCMHVYMYVRMYVCVCILYQILRKGLVSLGVTEISVKMINLHILQFQKRNTNNRDLIQQLLT